MVKRIAVGFLEFVSMLVCICACDGNNAWFLLGSMVVMIVCSQYLWNHPASCDEVYKKAGTRQRGCH